jgi:hypothetical protein
MRQAVRDRFRKGRLYGGLNKSSSDRQILTKTGRIKDYLLDAESLGTELKKDLHRNALKGRLKRRNLRMNE